MAEDWLKGPYVKVKVDYGWSSDEVEVRLYPSGFALVEKRTHNVIPAADAKSLVTALGKIDFKGVQKKVGFERARDGTHVDLTYVDGKVEKSVYWDYQIGKLTQKMDQLIDEVIELTRPKEEKK